jgi:hypothetical protein
MKSLLLTKIQEPRLIKKSCLLCKGTYHLEDTFIYDDEYTVCIDCSKMNSKEIIIKKCKENNISMNDADTDVETIKSVYSIRCKCFLSHEITIDGSRSIGVQDYIKVYCKCQEKHTYIP